MNKSDFKKILYITELSMPDAPIFSYETKDLYYHNDSIKETVIKNLKTKPNSEDAIFQKCVDDHSITTIIKDFFSKFTHPEYHPKKHDKLYFFKGCKLLRDRIRMWGEDKEIGITYKLSKANIKVISNDSLRTAPFSQERYVNHLDRVLLSDWLYKNYKEVAKKDTPINDLYKILKDPNSDYNDRVVVPGHLFTKINPNGVDVAGTWKFQNGVSSKGMIPGSSSQSPLVVSYWEIDKNISRTGSRYSINYLGYPNFLTEEGVEFIVHIMNNPVYHEDAIKEAISKDALVINMDSYHEIADLLGSYDEEFKLAGMGMLADCNYSESFLYIMFLLRRFGQQIYRHDYSTKTNFSSLLSYLGMHRNQLTSVSNVLSIDKIVEKALNKKCLTLHNIHLFSDLIKFEITRFHDLEHFEVKELKLKDSILSQLLPEKEVPEVEEAVEEVETTNLGVAESLVSELEDDTDY